VALCSIFGKLEGLKTLWSLAKEVELNLDELLLARTKQVQTALHKAAQNNHTEILQKLWVWTEEWQLNTNALKKIATSQRQKSMYCLAPCSIFWQIRGLKGTREFG